MISIYGKITKKIDNNFRKFKSLTKPQNRNLKEIAKGLMLTKTCFLSEIGRKLSPQKSDRKNIIRYSRCLEKIDSFELIKTHIKSKEKHLNNGYGLTNPNLVFMDGGDILKEYCPKKAYTEESRKMQYCCGTLDGSRNHEKAWGYKLMNISVHTPHNDRTHILSQHLYSSNAKDYKSDWDEQKKQLEIVQKIVDPDNTILIEDSIGDDAKRINFYHNDMVCRFITRSQNKRKYTVNFDGDKVDLTYSEIAQSVDYDTENTRDYFDKKMQQEVTSQISFLKVSHSDLVDNDKQEIDLYLILVKSEAYDEPMALLTNIEPENMEQAWRIFFWYKKRWEVEKIYRDIKQKFKLESALIRGYKAWQTLVFLTALLWDILQDLTADALEFFSDCYFLIADWLKKKQQKSLTHLCLLDFLRHFWQQFSPPWDHRSWSWKFFLHRFAPHKNQLSLFNNF